MLFKLHAYESLDVGVGINSFIHLKGLSQEKSQVISANPVAVLSSKTALTAWMQIGFTLGLVGL